MRFDDPRGELLYVSFFRRRRQKAWTLIANAGSSTKVILVKDGFVVYQAEPTDESSPEWVHLLVRFELNRREAHAVRLAGVVRRATDVTVTLQLCGEKFDNLTNWTEQKRGSGARYIRVQRCGKPQRHRAPRCLKISTDGRFRRFILTWLRVEHRQCFGGKVLPFVIIDGQVDARAGSQQRLRHVHFCMVRIVQFAGVPVYGRSY